MGRKGSPAWKPTKSRKPVLHRDVCRRLLKMTRFETFRHRLHSPGRATVLRDIGNVYTGYVLRNDVAIFEAYRPHNFPGAGYQSVHSAKQPTRLHAIPGTVIGILGRPGVTTRQLEDISQAEHARLS